MGEPACASQEAAEFISAQPLSCVALNHHIASTHLLHYHQDGTGVTSLWEGIGISGDIDCKPTLSPGRRLFKVVALGRSCECPMMSVHLPCSMLKGGGFPERLTSRRLRADLRWQEKMRENEYFEWALEWETSSGIWLLRNSSDKKGALLVWEKAWLRSTNAPCFSTVFKRWQHPSNYSINLVIDIHS